MYINEECIILVHKHDCEHNWGKGEIEIFNNRVRSKYDEIIDSQYFLQIPYNIANLFHSIQNYIT